MKILITAPSLNEQENVSGISSVVRLIMRGSRESFYHFQAGRRDGEAAGIDWIFKQMNFVPQFLRAIKREQIDVVHINTALNPLSIVRDFFFVKAARIRRRPIVLHLHGGRFLAADFQSSLLKSLTEKMLRTASVILVLSEMEKQTMTNRWKNLNVRVLENAVAVDEIRKLERFENERESEKTIIFLGRLHESKGLHEIIEACRVLKAENFQFRFKCFGAGKLKDFFVREMTTILGNNFFYGGIISGEEKWKQLSRSDIFLLPSTYGEGLPMAMLEAMAAGCVVVVSEMASVGAVIKDGVNGFLVEPRDVPQLIEKLKMLLSGEIDWKTLRRNAQGTVAEKYNLPDYIKKLEEIYAEIC
ncbi:MAG: glycosyltransferase family 4 protein [Pyrinomonadaceae bacterium]|jgi:glycosyltransferase involved in cell wall biosynthesis